jgi:hypothetical protein
MSILRDRLDIVDFWFDAVIPGETGGSQPMDLPLGRSNVTWIIRWDDIHQRDQA